jgi:hypothetical protein
MARLTVEKYMNTDGTEGSQFLSFSDSKSTKENATALSAANNSGKLTSYYFTSDASGTVRKKSKRSKIWE